MSTVVRAITTADLPQVERLDEAYASSRGLERLVDAGAVSFYERTGHSFVLARGGDGLDGFVLAQAVWNGRRPEVQLRRLVGSDDARLALLEAVVKSAYDSGVYDLLALLPEENGSLAGVLEEMQFGPRGMLVYERVLGSRGTSTGNP